MRVFITGASGFIGSHVTRELIAAGHHVLGMTRSDAGARTLADAGAEVYRGDLADLDGMRRAAGTADGVIHLGFSHDDFTKMVENCEADRRVITALGDALVGTDRPLVITSGTGIAGVVPGEPSREDNPIVGAAVHPRAASEEAGAALSARGVNVSVVRLPQVHDPVKQGLITYIVAITREKGVSAYLGDGRNRWSAAHVDDVARLYRLALEKHEAGSKYHAVAEEGVAARDIAEALGRGLNVPVASLDPEEAKAHFGWMTMFVGLDMPASSALTRQRLNWHPTGPTLLEDLAAMQYA